MNSTITPLVEYLEQLATKEPILRRKLPSSSEMEKVWRDFGVHLKTFRTIADGDALPSAIEVNLLRYNIAALEHQLKLLAGESPDPEIRAARSITERIRGVSADMPVRSIVPRLRRSKPGSIPDTESRCPECGRRVIARVEEGQIFLEWA